jgi:hypothetical protein
VSQDVPKFQQTVDQQNLHLLIIKDPLASPVIGASPK